MKSSISRSAAGSSRRGENPDEVNDKTVPRWRGEAAHPTTIRIVQSPEKGRFRRWSLPEVWDTTVPWGTGARTA
jgi:hypothetical protein